MPLILARQTFDAMPLFRHWHFITPRAICFRLIACFIERRHAAFRLFALPPPLNISPLIAISVFITSRAMPPRHFTFSFSYLRFLQLVILSYLITAFDADIFDFAFIDISSFSFSFDYIYIYMLHYIHFSPLFSASFIFKMLVLLLFAIFVAAWLAYHAVIFIVFHIFCCFHAITFRLRLRRYAIADFRFRQFSAFAADFSSSLLSILPGCHA